MRTMMSVGAAVLLLTATPARAQLAAYCSGASPRTAWVTWGAVTPQSACNDVQRKFFQLGDSVLSWRSGWYDPYAFTRVYVSCYTGGSYWADGWGASAFVNAVDRRPADNCVYETTTFGPRDDFGTGLTPRSSEAPTVVP